MKTNHICSNIATFDSKWFYNNRNQEKGYHPTWQTSKYCPCRSNQKHLFLHHPFYLLFRHSDRLKQTIITNFSSYRKIHNIINKQIRTQTGNCNQANKTCQYLNRCAKIFHEEKILLLSKIHIFDKSILLFFCHDFLLKIHKVTTGSCLRKLPSRLIIEFFRDIKLFLGSISVPEATIEMRRRALDLPEDSLDKS